MESNSQIPVVDLADLAEIRAADVSLLRSIIQQFLSDIDPHLLALKKGVEHQDGGKIRSEAHFFRGASANFRAEAFVAVCQELESLGRTGTLGPVRDVMERFIIELERVRFALNDEAAKCV